MTDTRRTVLNWAERGHILAPDLPRALTIAEVVPSHKEWRRFLDQVFLWLGTVLVSSGVITFFAYNWNDLGRFAKFSLVEALLLVTLLVVWRLGVDRTGGKAALLACCLLLGALLALIGQTYQTGADTFELFATWAAMILPWVLVGRFAALWLLWLALVDVAISLYFRLLPGAFGFLFHSEQELWVLFAFDTAALVVWEGVAAVAGIEWLRGRWGPRLVATASGWFVTVLAMLQVLGDRPGAIIWGVPAWLVWLAVAFAVYRYRVKDLFVLAGGVLSAIFVIAVFSAKHLSGNSGAGFLLVGMIVIALSAAGGWWLKQLATRDER
jgi:uncharacterized membrane protein